MARGEKPIWRLPSLVLFLLLGAILAGIPIDGAAQLPAPGLAVLLNLLIVVSALGVAAVVAALAYLADGRAGQLCLSCGTLAVGGGFAASSWLLAASPDPNAAISTQNLMFWGGGLLHLIGLTWGVESPPCSPGRRPVFLAGSCLAVLAGMAGLAILSRQGALPAFFIPAEGPTTLRQAVLGGAVLCFAAAAALLWQRYGRDRQEFHYWYGLALALLAAGGAAFLLQAGPWSMLGWTGRLAFYAGSLALLAAAWTVVRAAREARRSVGELAAASFRDLGIHYHAALETVTDAVIGFDRAGRVRVWNPAAARMLGVEPAEAVGARLADLLGPEADTERWWEERNDPERGSQIEIRVTRRDGSLFPAEAAISVRPTAAGGIGTCVLRDLTVSRGMERAEQEQRELAASLQQAAAALLQTLDLDEVLDRILAEVARMIPCEAGEILLLQAGESLSRSRGKIDLRAVRSHVGAPIKIRERTLGFVGLDSAAEGAFTARHADWLHAFADQAAIAIENARLHAAALRRGEELAALFRAANSLRLGSDLSIILEQILEEVIRVAGCSHARILLVDEAAGRLRPGAIRGAGPAHHDPVPLGAGLSGIVASTGQPLYSPDVRQDPRAHDPDRDRALGIVGYLGLPVIIRGTVAAVLVLNTTVPRAYSDEEIAYLAAFADQAAAAIEADALFRQEQERRQQLEAVRAVAEEITRELDLEPLLQLIIRRATELLDTPSGSIALWDETTQTLIPRAWVGFGDWLKGMTVPLGVGVVGTVAQRREGMIVNDYRAWDRATPAMLEQTSVTAVIGEPLLYRDRMLGVITVSNFEGMRPFIPSDRDTLALFATHAVIAIENARLYQELKRSFEELTQAQGELVRSEKLRGLGQMAAGIAHDLNNTLAVILGQAELLRSRVADPAAREALGPLETAATDGAAVVRRLQDFARQRAAAPLVPCDLATLAREAVELTRPRWQDEAQRRGARIRVMLDVPVGLPAILGHPPELREALTNLIFNAVDAMPDGGTLTFRARAQASSSGVQGADGRVQIEEAPGGQSQLATRQSPMVELAVTDTGVGIPPEIQERIFDPFFTTKGLHGTGLGLALVHSTVERHGGRIGVASTPGQGATFTLALRAAPPATRAAPAPPPATTPAAPRRLLLIEDEPAVRKSLAGLLRARGHTVLEAADGPAGLARLAAEPVDLLLTDLGMPGMTGWEVARAAAALRPGLPVVLLTGWGESVAADRPADVAVARLLSKPVRVRELEAVIRELTGTAG